MFGSMYVSMFVTHFLLVELVMSPIWPPIGQKQAASFPASGIAQTTHTVIREESLLKTDSGVCGGLRLTIASEPRLP